MFHHTCVFLDETSSHSNTDSDEDENDHIHDISSPKLPSTIQFPCLLNDTNINIRNAYVDGEYILSEFILMMECKETMAISCFTKKLTKVISGINFRFFFFFFFVFKFIFVPFFI